MREQQLESTPWSLTTWSPDPRHVVITLQGEHDLAARDRLIELAEAALDRGGLVLDLGRVEFIDGSVVSALVEIQAGAPSCTLVLPPAGTMPRRVLELLEIPTVVRCVERLDDALDPDRNSPAP